MLKYLCDGAALIEGKSLGFDVDELKILAVRRAGQVYVYANRCPIEGWRWNGSPMSFSMPAPV